MDGTTLCFIWAVRMSKSTGVDWSELLGAAWEGLAQAEERYDHSQGYCFSTFARNRIRGAIIDYLRRTQPSGKRRSKQLQSKKILSLDTYDRDSLIRSGDSIGREDDMSHFEAMLFVSEALCGRDRELIEMRLLGWNDSDIAREFGVSDSRISQMRKEIGERLVALGRISAPTSTKRRLLQTRTTKRSALTVSGQMQGARMSRPSGGGVVTPGK